jgi:sulfatase modifying factor 1
VRHRILIASSWIAAIWLLLAPVALDAQSAGTVPPHSGTAASPDNSAALPADTSAAALTPPEPEMALIPGGEFWMGIDEPGLSSPPHRVVLPPFYLDKTEVTNAAYEAFCKTTDRRLPEFWGMEEYCSGPGFPNHPVVGISWRDAEAYAKWRGARLPTEAEWEYAARGGLQDKKNSHGDELDAALYAPTGYTGTATPSPVASFPPNGFGLCDMTGNVAEWVADIFAEDYYSHSAVEDPCGPSAGYFRVVRGGGWHTGPGCMAVSYRTALRSNWVDFNTGFRCAKFKGESAAAELEQAIADSGLVAAVRHYWRMKAAPPGEYYFREREFNELAYRLAGEGALPAALQIAQLNAEAYPQSFNAHDSLGEIYLKQGDREAAVRHYLRAIELNPKCESARHVLDSLGVAP